MTRAPVTGASGFLDGNLATVLLAEGVEVTATGRPSTRVDHLADLQIRWMNANLTTAAGDALSPARTAIPAAVSWLRSRGLL